nr:hypothetical protein [Tanacetum cinerariifolium]
MAKTHTQTTLVGVYGVNGSLKYLGYDYAPYAPYSHADSLEPTPAQD